MITEKLSEAELSLYEVMRDPVWFGEFTHNLDIGEDQEHWEWTDYQKEFLLDYSPLVALRCGRVVGKTEVVKNKIAWHAVNKFFDGILFTVPNRSHLDPVFVGVQRMFRVNPLLKFWFHRFSANSQQFTIKFTNEHMLTCRIAGTSGTGVNVVGLHLPIILLDECVVGTQQVACKNSNRHVSNLKVGDKVLSWNGYDIEEDTVVSVRKINRTQDIIEIGFDGGYLRVGENHRIFTGLDYLPAKDLHTGNTIYLYHNTKRTYWTPDELESVYDGLEVGRPIKEIAKKLNRSTRSVFGKLNKLGLKVKEFHDDLSEEERQILLGSLLGDGSLDVYKTRAAYCTNHSYLQKEYVDWLAQKLARLVRTKPQVRKNGGWGTWNYSFRTLASKELLESSPYKGGRKVITREYLNRLSPLGLAVWFMDDGSDRQLATHSFNEEEHEIIIRYFEETWGINAYIMHDTRKDLYFLGISNWKEFKNLIRPHIHPSMLYKLGEGPKPLWPELPKIADEEPLLVLAPIEVNYVKIINTRAKVLYDIEIEKNKNFFVNGILTKNSAYFPWGTWIELQQVLNDWEPGHQTFVSGVPDGRRDRSVLYACDNDENYSHHRIAAQRNPRFSPEREEQLAAQFGGRDSQDYIRQVLGEHGTPTYAVFDREFMRLEDYDVPVIRLYGAQLKKDSQLPFRVIANLPRPPKHSEVSIFGVDLGYTQPTAINALYLVDNVWYFLFRLELFQVSYDEQEKMLNNLDTKYNPAYIGMDMGSGGQGKALYHTLINDSKYKSKDFEKRLVPIEFGGTVVVGRDEEGKELKERIKQFAATQLQQMANNHFIAFSARDSDLIDELEKVIYYVTPNGNIQYKVMTPKGSDRGADHNFAALLTFAMVIFEKYEFKSLQQRSKRLVHTRWLK